MLENVSELKWLSHAYCREVGGHHTKVESEESIAPRRRNMQVRRSNLALKTNSSMKRTDVLEIRAGL